MPQGGLSDEQQAEAARARARDARSGSATADAGPRRRPPTSQLLADHASTPSAAWTMAPYLPLLEEELAYRGEDRRAPAWQLGRARARTSTSASSIIGAGMSGLLAAHRLQQAGVPFVILEKNDDVGGTWFENTYPGCRVDNPNHNYSYSFAQRHDWPFHFSTQDVLLDYFRRCADAFGLREHIRFATEVRRGRLVRRPTDVDGARARRRRRRGDARRRRRRQRGRPAEPAGVSRHRRARLASPVRRSTPRAGITTSTSRASGSR